jgi:hypothetical protein
LAEDKYYIIVCATHGMVEISTPTGACPKCTTSYRKGLIESTVDGRPAEIKADIRSNDIVMYVFMPATGERYEQAECRITYKQGAQITLVGDAALHVHKAMEGLAWPW